jgi:hypothetical protein
MKRFATSNIEHSTLNIQGKKKPEEYSRQDAKAQRRKSVNT